MTPLFPDIYVNGEKIASADISAEAQNHAADPGKPGHAWRAAARALAVRTLLLQVANDKGITPDPQNVGPERVETPDESVIRQVVEQEISPADVSDAECLAIYERQPETFRSPDLYQPAHILFPAKPDDDAARNEARALAEAVLVKVLAKPAKFGTFAKEFSACPSRENAGQLGQINTGETVPEFEAVLKVLPEGTIHPEPVETRYGFHIVKMDKATYGQVLPFDAVKVQIREKLEQISWVKAANAYTAQLIAGADIKGIDLNKPIEAAA